MTSDMSSKVYSKVSYEMPTEMFSKVSYDMPTEMSSKVSYEMPTEMSSEISASLYKCLQKYFEHVYRKPFLRNRFRNVLKIVFTNVAEMCSEIALEIS